MEAVKSLLDCEGLQEEDGSTPLPWSQLREESRRFLASDAGLLAVPNALFSLARRVTQRWTPLAMHRARQQLSLPLRGQMPLKHAPPGFCIYGVMTALFWQCFDITPETPATTVVRCLQRLTKGPLLCMDSRQNWGPLEFSQSSQWPLQLLDVRLVLDHWQACSVESLQAAHCHDAGPKELRAHLGLSRSLLSQEEKRLLSITRVSEMVAQQIAAPLPPPLKRFFPPSIASLHVSGSKSELTSSPLRLVVIGSHLGSNMEPLSMVQACFEQASLALEASVIGTAYPFPELACEMFGQCTNSKPIGDAVRLLVAQMYRPSWEPLELLRLLSAGFQENPLQQADLILCAQPMALCSLLRSLTDLPMLLYQAFPLVGATPVSFRHLLLVQLKEVQVANQRRSSLIAYSEFLAQQVQRQTGRRPICLRPHSLYASRPPTGGPYAPDKDNPRVLIGRVAGWARDSAGALLSLVRAFAEDFLRPSTSLRLVFLGANIEASDTIAGISRPFEYHELRRFQAGVYFPWDMGMLLFSELYAVGVPVLLPDRAWMSSIIKRMLEYTDFGWWQAREEGSAVALPTNFDQPSTAHDAGKTRFDLNWPWFGQNSTVAHILSLYDLTDFVRWPHVLNFQSLSELMIYLRSADFDKISRDMMLWNEAVLPQSLNILARSLGSMLSNRTQPLAGDESTCV